MDLTKVIREKVLSIEDQLIEWRREIHHFPELAFKEKKTSAMVIKKLRKWGLSVERITKTGIVGVLKGKTTGSGRTIAIRADMDGLPIEEKTGLSFSSCKEGVMHACGHDGHTAMVLGTAYVLSELREYISGNIKFIFQPAEEGPGGAQPMIEAGVLENPDVDAIIALHIAPDIASSVVGIKEGVLNAAVDNFKIMVKGKGTHGAHPDQGIDPILISSHIIQAFQGLVSRETDPLEPVVISCGSIHAGTAPNIIPETLEINGTVRTLNQIKRETIYKRIKEVVAGITGAMKAEYKLDYEFGYPSLINDNNIIDQVKKVAMDILGEKRIVDITRPSMGAEDFAYFLEKVPGAMFFLGTKNPEKGVIHPAHCSFFDIDEDILATGVEVFCNMVFELLD